MRTKTWIALCAAMAAGTAAASTTYTSGSNNTRSTVAVSNHSTCAIRDDQLVVCISQGVPYEVGISRAVQISASSWRLCAATDEGRVFCSDNKNPPYEVTGFNEFVVAVNVAPGAASTPSSCAVTASGKAMCWGGNEDGQLGDGTTTDRASPVAVKGVSGVVGLASGYRGTGDQYCAMRYTGGVRCWGVGVSTPVAVTNGDYVRNLTIAGGHVCLWRRQESASSVHCAPGSQLTNFANYVELPFSYPSGMSGNIYGGLCVADHGQDPAWRCMDTFYGLSITPRAAFMTSLSTNSTSLQFGDFAHSCALKYDDSLSCMLHGTLVPPCDIATHGAACHTQPTLYFGEITPSRPAVGIWTLIPNLSVLEPTRPRMFGSITDLAKLLAARTLVSVSWTPPAHSTDYDLQICDLNNLCKGPLSEPQSDGNGKLRAFFVNLRPNTEYVVKVQGHNWASDQGAPATLSVRTTIN
jgi:hypothetical protein